MIKNEIFCPICNSNNFNIIYSDSLGENLPLFDYNFNNDLTQKSYRIVKCKICSHFYASPLPINISSYYQHEKIDTNYLDISEQRILTAEKLIKIIRKYKTSGNLLDIGCGTGDFLEIASRNFKVEGLEISFWAANIASKRGFKVEQCYIKDLSTVNQYDIITLWGVIEHFERPRIEIEHIYKLIKPGGLLFIWTPDISSWIAKIMKKKWWNFQGQHIQLFTKESLNYLLVKQNFGLVENRIYPYIMTLESLQNSLTRYPIIARLTKYIFLNKYLKNFYFPLYLPGELLGIYKKIM